jgi:hypothetical protein
VKVKVYNNIAVALGYPVGDLLIDLEHSPGTFDESQVLEYLDVVVEVLLTESQRFTVLTEHHYYVPLGIGLCTHPKQYL